MKHIVLSIFSLQGGGAERFVLTLAQGFKDLGYQPHIICFKKHSDYNIPSNIPVHFLNYQSYRWIPKTLRNPLFAKVFDKFVTKNISKNPALVLSNLWQVDLVLQYSQFSNKVFVIHNTLSKEKQVHSYLTNDALNAVYGNKKVVTVSNGVLSDFSQIVLNSDSLTAIHNPIDKHRIIEQAKDNIGLTDEISAKLKNGYVVHVGKFKGQKNHIDLIKAYANTNTNKRIPLVLVGQGPLQQDCEQLCEQLNITNDVIFTGFTSNPYPLIDNATGMVLSSIYEGFGIVIAEALALGIPVISTDCESGPRELLPQKNLVPVKNIEALSQKLQLLMDNPDMFKSAFDETLLPTSIAKKYLQVVQENI